MKMEGIFLRMVSLCDPSFPRTRESRFVLGPISAFSVLQIIPQHVFSKEVRNTQSSEYILVENSPLSVLGASAVKNRKPDSPRRREGLIGDWLKRRMLGFFVALIGLDYTVGVFFVYFE